MVASARDSLHLRARLLCSNTPVLTRSKAFDAGKNKYDPPLFLISPAHTTYHVSCLYPCRWPDISEEWRTTTSTSTFGSGACMGACLSRGPLHTQGSERVMYDEGGGQSS